MNYIYEISDINNRSTNFTLDTRITLNVSIADGNREGSEISLLMKKKLVLSK